MPAGGFRHRADGGWGIKRKSVGPASCPSHLPGSRIAQTYGISNTSQPTPYDYATEHSAAPAGAGCSFCPHGCESYSWTLRCCFHPCRFLDLRDSKGKDGRSKTPYVCISPSASADRALQMYKSFSGRTTGRRTLCRAAVQKGRAAAAETCGRRNGISHLLHAGKSTLKRHLIYNRLEIAKTTWLVGRTTWLVVETIPMIVFPTCHVVFGHMYIRSHRCRHRSPGQ